MIVSGKKLSSEMIRDYVDRGNYSLTLAEAIKRFGGSFIAVQPVPADVEEIINNDGAEPPDDPVFLGGLYVPNT